MQRRRSSIAWLVTHAEKEDCPNPGMTPQGKERVQSLRKTLAEHLPHGPSQVHVGTGRRQFQVAEALGLSGYDFFFSAVWGEGVTETKRDSKSLIMLADGRLIDWDHYLSPQHLQFAIRWAILKLPVDALICSGRPVLVRLGMAFNDPRCQGGALYAIHFDNNDPESIEVELVVSGVNLNDNQGGAI